MLALVSDDLIARLRRYGGKYHDTPSGRQPVWPITTEAADEIERLRAIVDGQGAEFRPTDQMRIVRVDNDGRYVPLVAGQFIPSDSRWTQQQMWARTWVEAEWR